MSGGQLELPPSPSDGTPPASTPNRTFGILSPPNSGHRRVVQQRDAQSASGSLASPTPSSGLLPAFSTRPYSRLPTPKSPKHTPRRFSNAPATPDSPLNHSPASHLLPRPYQQPTSPQTLTPGSSPFVQRGTHQVTVSQTGSTNDAFDVDTLDASLEFPVTGLAPPHRITSPLRSRSESPIRSHRSSPSIDKASPLEKAGGHALPPHISSSGRFAVVDDVFMARPSAPMEPPPASTAAMLTPPHSHRFMRDSAGSQQFWSQSWAENTSSSRDAESRRPDYLKRATRPIPDTSHAVGTVDAEMEDRVGIAMTPVKGRRLKLFQETSEESFEESLMAGGYGRYRTLAWAAHAPTSDSADPPAPIPTPDPGIGVSPRDLKKQKRLAAFRESGQFHPTTKLFPVDIEGKGRLLLNVPGDGRSYSTGTGTTKKGPNRRRKRPPVPEAFVGDDTNARGPTFPNWPDLEFPWRLRTQERAEMARAQEEAKLSWIEKFLDRDTDEEDEEADAEPRTISWNRDNDPSPIQAPGKRVHSRQLSLLPKKKRKAVIRNPASDARSILLSKKSLRGMSSRKQRNGDRRADDNEDEVLCICQGRGDGTLGSVQCDGCLEWFHFQCIGITSQSELGSEEDPWYCNQCATRSPSPEPALSSEPTLVPTHDEPSRSPCYDPPFFQIQLGDSPMPSWAFSKQTRTPTRNGFGEEVSPSSSYMPGPYTPQWRDPSCEVRVFSTPGPPAPLTGEEHPFDPTSTPSRGISLPGSFMTPKSRSRTFIPPYAAQAPSKVARSASSQRMYSQSSHGDASAYILPHNSQLGSLPSFDDTPLGRAQYDSSRSALVQKTPISPVLPRPSGTMQLLLPVSPIVWSREGPREGDANRRRE